MEELEVKKDQYRKELRLELKKIKSDVEDITRAFDDRLNKLCVERDEARGFTDTYSHYNSRMNCT